MSTLKPYNFILDLLFPKKCFGCKKPDTYICESCLNKLSLSGFEIKNKNECPICKRPILLGQICKPCKIKTNLDNLFWAVPYSNALIKKAIKAFKYRFVKELASPLAETIIQSLPSCWRLSLQHNSALVPIPLFKKRLKARGFNQAELLAQEISNYFSTNLETKILQRTQNITPQANIKNNEHRKENIKNNFKISKDFSKKCIKQNKNLLKNKTIILVDDVFTTGATLSEAAKILKNAGAKKVIGLVIAKG